MKHPCDHTECTCTNDRAMRHILILYAMTEKTLSARSQRRLRLDIARSLVAEHQSKENEAKRECQRSPKSRNTTPLHSPVPSPVPSSECNVSAGCVDSGSASTTSMAGSGSPSTASMEGSSDCDISSPEIGQSDEESTTLDSI